MTNRLMASITALYISAIHSVRPHMKLNVSLMGGSVLVVRQ